MNGHRIEVRHVSRRLRLTVEKPVRRPIVVEGDRAAPPIESARFAAMLDLVLKCCRRRIDLVDLLWREAACWIAAPAESARPAQTRFRTTQTANPDIDNVLVGRNRGVSNHR